ncbi:alpha/beta fold hydrolase [Leifsonia sp. NPDC056665]|uniref:alpha/beta fold hydrolase n=1 Tax=Leifsonia sp. NPDC056665 TaxID=3345901 RepID=UPI00367F7F0B
MVTFDSGASEGGAVLLLHGIGVSSRYFHRLAPVLAEQGRTIAVDLPGFGRARKPARRLTVEDYAGLVAEFLDARSLGSVMVVGHSMGAQIATNLARRRPDLVAQIVLLGPAMAPVDRTPLRAGSRLALDIIRESPHSNALVLTDYVRCGPRWYLKVLPSMLAYRIEDDLPKLGMPVTIVRGDRDPIARTEWSHAIASLAPQGRFVEVRGAPHVVMLSRPREIARRVEPAARAPGAQPPATV